MIPLYKWPSTKLRKELKARRILMPVFKQVAQIVEDVQENGDKALYAIRLFLMVVL